MTSVTINPQSTMRDVLEVFPGAQHGLGKQRDVHNLGASPV